MTINRAFIEKTEEYLKNTFKSSSYLNEHPQDREYRLQHSYRVTNIGRIIAEKEGFDRTEMVIGCLLHDIAYSEVFEGEDGWLNHGRRSAVIARPFLHELGLKEDRIEDICYGIAIHVDNHSDFEDICYGIAIHVDNHSDFEGIRTPFALTIGD